MTRPPMSSRKRIKRTGNASKQLANKLGKPGGAAKARSKTKRKRKPKHGARTIKYATSEATIEIAQPTIEYDEGLRQRAGYLRISPGAPALVPPNGDTLLHLLFFLIYTEEGEQILEAHRPDSAATPELAKGHLKAALRRSYPTLGDDRLDAVIDAHFAADAYVDALDADDPAEQRVQHAIYAQKLLAILGELHDDAMAHEFSMRW